MKHNQGMQGMGLQRYSEKEIKVHFFVTKEGKDPLLEPKDRSSYVGLLPRKPTLAIIRPGN